MKNFYQDDIHLLRSVVEQLPTPVALFTGAELLITMVNEAMLKVWHKGKEIADNPFVIALPELQDCSFGKTLRKTIQSGKPCETGKYELHDSKNTSPSSYYNFFFKPLRNEDQVVWGILCTATNITELVRTQKELEGRQFSFLINSSHFISIGTAGGKAVYLNPAGRNLVGLDPDEDILKLESRDFYSASEYGRFREEVLPALLKNGKWSGLLHLKHFKTNEEIPCLAEIITIMDPDTGQMEGRGAIFRDLRPEIASKKALMESEKRLRHIVAQAPVPIAVLKEESLILEAANHAMLNLMGKTDAIIGKPLLEVLPELNEQIFPDLLKKVYDTGKPLDGSETLAYLERDGKLEKHYFNFAYAPFLDNDDDIPRIIMRYIDVTPQVNAKIELERNEKRFRSVALEGPIAAAVFIGKDLILDLANDAMLQLWGHNRSIIGKRLTDALPELHLSMSQVLTDVLETGRSSRLNQRNKSGNDPINGLDFLCKPLLDTNGKVYGVLQTAFDSTAHTNL